MRKFWQILAAIAAALILGLGSAVWAVNSVAQRTWVKNGAWHIDLAVGSSEADLYTRAAVARSGLFALNKSETIYFVTSTDDEGRSLSSECDYRVEGRDLEARWWSITLYGADYFLIPNEQKKYSYNWRNVERQPDGGYVIHVSPTPKKGNWIPSGREKQLYLSLRLYNPVDQAVARPDQAILPRIIREGRR
ncbi:MAG: DUF1214 domain-containing protein [Thermodesulfobacteriota bacterium]